MYSTLEVPRTATLGELRKAFKRLSLSLHPDKNRNADAVTLFQKVKSAYEVRIIVLRESLDRTNKNGHVNRYLVMQKEDMCMTALALMGSG